MMETFVDTSYKSLQKTIDNIKTSYFFNNFMVICVFNDGIIKEILMDSSNYLKNTFVFLKLRGDKVKFYHISSPNDLIISDNGSLDVSDDCFTIDTNEIDVILVSGLFDRRGNWTNTEHNTGLYTKLFNQLNKAVIGVGLECQIQSESLPETERQVDGFLTEEGLYSIVEILEV